MKDVVFRTGPRFDWEHDRELSVLDMTNPMEAQQATEILAYLVSLGAAAGPVLARPTP